ncbi:MAG: sulfurtransferase complex subunit TusB [Gammaproteobacteria bacterium]|nr:sulfurtransferase complex subunit TusB [Gammaproteobacteria bacterium]
MMLLIATKSPFAKALPLPNKQSTLLLTQDAVLATNIAQLTLGFGQVYALADDVSARGLTADVALHIELIDYHKFVQLTLKHQPIVSW